MYLITETQHISRFPRACESVQEFTTREEAEALFLLRRKCERVSFLYVETVRSLLICNSKQLVKGTSYGMRRQEMGPSERILTLMNTG